MLQKLCLSAAPSTLTNATERISLGFLQETPYRRISPCSAHPYVSKGKWVGFGQIIDKAKVWVLWGHFSARGCIPPRSAGESKQHYYRFWSCPGIRQCSFCVCHMLALNWNSSAHTGKLFQEPAQPQSALSKSRCARRALHHRSVFVCEIMCNLGFNLGIFFP